MLESEASPDGPARSTNVYGGVRGVLGGMTKLEEHFAETKAKQEGKKKKKRPGKHPPARLGAVNLRC